jgi:SAM-dependent methyltransferase
VRPPLTAYTIDVAGSIAGSLLFALVSFLGAPPGVWFALAALGVLALPQRGGVVRVLNAAILLAVVVGVSVLGRSSYWSPYYRIDLQPRPGHGWALFVNNIGHQEVAPYAVRVRRSIFYVVPFKTFHFPPSTRELIIGAGSGSDADVAVHNGIRHITGVEIDPTIYDLGRRLHPDHIYQKPGVHVVIGDGRAFLERTQGTYDLIVFALPDSLALTSSFANLRLESYLFTREAFEAARRHLSPNGVLVLYNYYRQPWVVHKIAGMLTEAFGGQVPYGHIYKSMATAAVLMDGPRLRTLPPALYAAHRIGAQPGVDSATDDWPFLYLQAHSVPTIYLQAIALVWLLAATGVLLSLGRGGLRRFDAALFFMGLAFLLLEAKSIVNFTLLFGATWLVNALVIVGILATVLLANWVNAATRLRLDLRLLYLGLALAVALNLLLPFQDLLVPNLALRYALGCAVLFSPILLANLVFGRLFGETLTPDIAFASNLLGAFVGGTLEYLSLQIGYHLLLLPVAAAYALSLVAVARRRGRAVDLATAAAAR